MRAEYVDHMGTDLSVVNAARVSFDKVSGWDRTCSCGVTEVDGRWPGCGSDVRTCPSKVTRSLKNDDAKLISYLARHNHWTPFAHTAITLRMGAPVPIRTQCFKHKAGFVENEESRRYISGKPEVYWPTWRKAPVNGAKQGSSEEFEQGHQDWFNGYYRAVVNDALANYQGLIDQGVCPEQARLILPQGCMVNWIWTGNLASFARFYWLRTEPHAQREVAELAMKVGEIIELLFPVSWKALTTPTVTING